MAGCPALGRHVGRAPAAARVDDDVGAALGIGPRDGRMGGFVV